MEKSLLAASSFQSDENSTFACLPSVDTSFLKDVISYLWSSIIAVIVAYFKSKKECEMAKIEFQRNFENYWCNTSKTL